MTGTSLARVRAIAISGVDGIPVDPADVVDTTGAGDAFCGALAASLCRGDARDLAMRWAVHAGAAAVQHRGAQTDPSF